MFRASFPNYRQLDKMDCGPTCLKIIAKHYGKDVSLEQLRKSSYIDREGVSLAGIKEAANLIDIETFSVIITWEEFLEKAPQPSIIHWQGNHFMVVYKVSNSKVFVSDPAKGKYTLSVKEFKKGWLSEKGEGVVMLLEPKGEFYKSKFKLQKENSFAHIFKSVVSDKSI